MYWDNNIIGNILEHDMVSKLEFAESAHPPFVDSTATSTVLRPFQPHGDWWWMSHASLHICQSRTTRKLVKPCKRDVDSCRQSNKKYKCINIAGCLVIWLHSIYWSPCLTWSCQLHSSVHDSGMRIDQRIVGAYGSVAWEVCMDSCSSQASQTLRCWTCVPLQACDKQPIGTKMQSHWTLDYIYTHW